VRNAYDCFLTNFPLFFGYWKEYADLEFSIGGTETAEITKNKKSPGAVVSSDLLFSLS
jgi:pre-mRNA-processing factor 39